MTRQRHVCVMRAGERVHELLDIALCADDTKAALERWYRRNSLQVILVEERAKMDCAAQWL